MITEIKGHDECQTKKPSICSPSISNEKCYIIIHVPCYTVSQTRSIMTLTSRQLNSVYHDLNQSSVRLSLS